MCVCVCVCVCICDYVFVGVCVLFEEYNMMTISLMIWDLSVYMLLLVMSSAKSAPLLVRQGVVEMTANVIIVKSSMGRVRETPH